MRPAAWEQEKIVPEVLGRQCLDSSLDEMEQESTLLCSCDWCETELQDQIAEC